MNRLRAALRPGLLIAACAIVAHYQTIGSLGLYDDDFSTIPAAWDMSFVELLASSKNLIFGQSGGHPLVFIFINCLTWISHFAPNPLLVVHLLGAALLAVSAALFFLILRRLSFSTAVSAAGTIVFILNPSDSTRTFLTHAVGIQAAQALIFLAFLSYLAKRRVLGFLFAALCLLTYEPYFALFAIAPALDTDVPLKVRNFAKHAALCGIILGLDFAWRYLSGEQRASEAGGASMLAHATWNVFIGPVYGLGGLLWKPFRVGIIARHWEWQWWVRLLPGLLVSGFLWRWLRQDSPSASQASTPAWQRTTLAAVGLLLAAYSLSLTVTADLSSLYGRPSRIHGVAAMGLGLLCATALSASRGIGRRVAVAIFSVWVAVAIGAGVGVQKDYVESWAIQRQLWTDIVSAPVSWTPNTDLVLDITEIQTTSEMETLPWSSSNILNELLPVGTSKSKPRFHRMYEGKSLDLRLDSRIMDAYLGPALPPRRAVTLGCVGGRVVPIEFGNQVLPPTVVQSPLQQALIKRPEEGTSPYCAPAPRGFREVASER